MAVSHDKKLLAEWFWIDRWDGSSASALAIDARGLYREMLSQAWRRGARLPNDHEAIKRLCRVTDREWDRCWPKVQGYWHLDADGFLVNDTQLEVYADALRRQKADSTRGQAGAKARWKRDAQVIPSRMPEQLLPGVPAQVPEQMPTHHGSTARAIATDHRSPITETQTPPVSSSGAQTEPHLRVAGQLATNGTTDDAIAERAGRFMDRFAQLFTQERNGAHYMGRPAHDWPRACEIVQTWPDDDYLDELVICFLNSDQPFIAQSNRSIPVFASRASWCDDRLRQAKRAAAAS